MFWDFNSLSSYQMTACGFPSEWDFLPQCQRPEEGGNKEGGMKAVISKAFLLLIGS